MLILLLCSGNQYRFNKVLGSLTLGGYDAAIIEPNELTIPLSSAGISDLTVNIHSITMSSQSGNQSLSSALFAAYVDSTAPYLYLPIEVCEKFEEAFGIRVGVQISSSRDGFVTFESCLRRSHSKMLFNEVLC